MFTSVSIRNWQSLRALDLELGRFTVIVGASSSGKSALMRAFRAAASNATGNAAVTRGADAAAITVRTHTDAAVTLEYARGAWRYRLVVGDQEMQFTKLNRSVPNPVTVALRVDPVPANGSSLNFAGQFDRPYLLTDTGATVARILGELTNVDTVYAAAREANRRKAADAATLRTRQADLTRTRTELEQFRDLPQRLTWCETAERRADSAAATADRITRLRTALETLDVAETVLARRTELPPAPDDSAAQRSFARRRDFHERLRNLRQSTVDVCAGEKAVVDATAHEQRLQQEHRQTLATLGTCPTCEQPIPTEPAAEPAVDPAA